MGLETFAPFILGVAMLGVVIVARAVFGLVCRAEGFSLTRETVVNDNPAIGIRYAAFLVAVILSFSNIIHPSGISFVEDLSLLVKYAAIVMTMLLVSRYVNDALILYDFSNNKEVLGEKNIAVAIVESATYLATAFIISGALAGWEGGYLVSIGWFAVGQVLLIILALLYRLLVPGAFKALDDHNHACALSLGGLLFSGGLVLGHAVNGPFNGWAKDLTNVGLYMLWWALAMFVAHFVADKVMLPSSRLRDEVMNERNVAAGVIEGVVFIATTILYITVA